MSIVPKKCSLLLLSTLLFGGCQPNSYLLEPTIAYTPPPSWVQKLPSAFPKLSPEESSQDWGREMKIAEAFVEEMDLYQAMTSYKRAKALLPATALERRQQIDYDIMLCYYLGGKYQEVIETFENSSLTQASASFPSFGNLLILLEDSYRQIGNEEKACAIHQLIEKDSPEIALNLSLSAALTKGEIEKAKAFLCSSSHPLIDQQLAIYHSHAKSVNQAQMLNALMPGAGYWYIGQQKTALTSFVINALFTAAAYQFFHRGYIAAGAITTSLEFGWYLGGINGAGLAAKAYNERIYSDCVREGLSATGLFPILMFETTF